MRRYEIGSVVSLADDDAFVILVLLVEEEEFLLADLVVGVGAGQFQHLRHCIGVEILPFWRDSLLTRFLLVETEPYQILYLIGIQEAVLVFVELQEQLVNDLPKQSVGLQLLLQFGRFQLPHSSRLLIFLIMACASSHLCFYNFFYQGQSKNHFQKTEKVLRAYFSLEK